MIRTLVVVSVLLVLVVLVFSVPLSAVPQDKVTICHYPPGNPANVHEITISWNAWPAHEAHGDVIAPEVGGCSVEGIGPQ